MDWEIGASDIKLCDSLVALINLIQIVWRQYFVRNLVSFTVHFLDFLYEVLLNTYIGNSQYCFFLPPCSLSVEIIWSCIVPIQDLNIKGYSWETHLSRYVTYRIYSTDSMHISNTAHLTWSFLVVFSEWIKKRDVYNVS